MAAISEVPGATFEDIHSTASVGLVASVISDLDLSSVSTVADLGCGAGRFAIPIGREIAPRGGTVYALDRAGQELERIRKCADAEGLPILTVEANVLDSTALPRHSMDLVMLNFVLNLLRPPQLDMCVENAAALLRPNGRLLVSAYGLNHIGEAYEWLIDALVETGVSRADAQQAGDRIKRSRSGGRFEVGSGIAVLGRCFDAVTFTRFHDTLEGSVHEVGNLVAPSLLGSRILRDLVTDTRTVEAISEAFFSAMRSAATDGVLRLRVDIGTLIASKPASAAHPAGQRRLQVDKGP